MTSDTCPHCRTNLTGKPIPESLRPHYGGNTHFSRMIQLVEGNRSVGWFCPDCKRRID